MIEPKEILIGGIDQTKEVIEFSKRINLKEHTSNRHSLFFEVELYIHSNLIKDVDPFMVIDEIKFLEGKKSSTGTKPASQFTRSAHIKGLWHKHYLQCNISSMSQNLLIALKNYGIPYLENKVKEVEETGVMQYTTLEDINAIAKEVVENNYSRRAEDEKITGEWIVFAEHEEKKYYICLGKHKNTNSSSTDEEIRKKFDITCDAEFPFLKQIFQKTNN